LPNRYLGGGRISLYYFLKNGSKRKEIMDFITIGLSFIGGIAVSGIGLYNFVKKRISPEEAKRIYTAAKQTIDDYRAAMAKGSLTPDDKLKIAEDAVKAVEEIIKDLEQ